MSGTSALLIDRVASLLPKTTAGACVPSSPFTDWRQACNATDCCSYYRNCHYSCNGNAVCSGWHLAGCF